LIGKIGTDVSGLAALDLLRKQQVDVTFVRQSQQIGTGRALIVRDEADQKAMVSHRGANQDLSLDDINDDVCANADAILVSGYSLLATPQAEVANWLIRHGRARGIPVVLDVVPHRVAKEGMTTYYSAALSEVNCLIVELGTAKALLGKPEVSESSVLQLLLKRYEMVILRPNNEEQILAFGSERIVQRTGYGTASNKTGYLDKVSVQVLYRWLSARRASAKEW
jgi:sugar/nucleoside kinase (ribokinase family)